MENSIIHNGQCHCLLIMTCSTKYLNSIYADLSSNEYRIEAKNVWIVCIEDGSSAVSFKDKRPVSQEILSVVLVNLSSLNTTQTFSLIEERQGHDFSMCLQISFQL